MKKLILFLIFLMILPSVYGVSLTACEFLDPLAHWNLTNLNPLNDCTGNAPHTGLINLTLHDVNSPVHDINGTDCQSGDIDYMKLTNLSFGNYSTDSFSICMNLYIRNTVDFGSVVSKWGDGGNTGWTSYVGSEDLNFRSGPSIISTAANIPNATFFLTCFVKNSSHAFIYINDTLDSGSVTANTADVNPVNPEELRICYDPQNTWPLSGIIANLTFYNIELLQQNVTDILNGSFGESAVDSGTVEIIFANDTSATEIINSTLLEANFFTFLNWTNDANGNILNNSIGTCNVSFFDDIAIINNSPNDNFSLCTSGCDFITLQDNFTFDEINTSVVDNLSRDAIEFNACHEQNQVRDLTIDILCGSNSNQFTVDEMDFALCSEGSTPIDINFTDCLGEELIFVNITNTAPNSQRHRIDNLHYNRIFIKHHIQEPEILFNNTLQLWSFTKLHEYVSSGVKNVSASCFHNTSTDFSDTTSRTIEAGSLAPLIQFNTISNNIVTVNLSDDVSMEYAQGDYNFSTTVSDRDLANITYTITNTSGGVIFTQFNTSSVLITVNGTDLFRDEQETNYTFNVTAFDVEGTVSSQQITFEITDSVDPVCTGLDNTTHTNNTIFTYNVTCTDESFFSFNISCSNGFSSFEDGLDVTTFTFTSSMSIVNDTTCDFEFCDGHTEKNIDPMIISNQLSKSRRTFDNKIEVKTDTTLKTYKTDFKGDRHEFKVSFNELTSSMNWTITSDEFIHIMNNPKYMGWVITGDYWVDFNSPNVKRYEGLRISDTEVFIKLEFFRAVKEITFNSIGKKNCISGTQEINATVAEEAFAFQLKRFECDLTTTGKSIAMVGFTFILIIIWFFAIHEGIPALEFIIGFIFWYFSWSIANCFFLANILFILMGFMIVFKGLIDFFEKNKLI